MAFPIMAALSVLQMLKKDKDKDKSQGDARTQALGGLAQNMPGQTQSPSNPLQASGGLQANPYAGGPGAPMTGAETNASLGDKYYSQAGFDDEDAYKKHYGL